MDASEIGKNFLGVVHIAGSTVLGAFGMGKVAEQLGALEDQTGYLPEWAGGTSTAGTNTADRSNPDRFGRSRVPTRTAPDAATQQKMAMITAAVEVLRKVGWTDPEIKEILAGPVAQGNPAGPPPAPPPPATPVTPTARVAAGEASPGHEVFGVT